MKRDSCKSTFDEFTFYVSRITFRLSTMGDPRAQLKRVTEERDILKKAAAYFAKELP